MKKYQTVKQLQERTGYCRATIMKFFDKPGISFRVGRALRFDADAIDKAIEELGVNDDSKD